MTDKQHWKDIALAAILLLVAPLALFPELIWGGQTLSRMDITWIQYPLHVFTAESLQAGQWPLWNPYALCGFPAFAEGQASMISPLNLVFLLPIPPYLALSWFVLLHIGLAAVFTFVLARTLGLGRPAAVLAGLSFGFGGAITAQITNFCIMTGLVWVPLALCLHILASERTEVIWPILTGATLALQLLDGHPQLVSYTILLLGAYTLYQIVRLIRRRAPWREMTRSILVLGLAGVVGLGLSAVQLVPMLELWRETVRAHGMHFSEVVSQSEHPLQLIQLLVPNIFGNPMLGYKGLDSFEELYAYFGLLPLFLILPAWRRRSDPHARFLWLALPVTVLLAFGSYTPLYGLLWHVPGFDLFRIPGRWLMLTGLVWALLAGYGLDELSRHAGGSRTLLLTLGAATALLGGLAAWTALSRAQLLDWVGNHFAKSESGRLLSEALRRLLQPADPRPENWLPNLAPWLNVPGVTTLLLMAAALGILAACLTRRLSSRTAAVALVGLTAIDLFAFGGTSVIHLEASSYWQADPQILDLVREKTGDFRVFALDTTSPDEKKAMNGWAGRHETIDWMVHFMPTVFHVASPMGKRTGMVMERYERFIGDVPSRRVTDMTSLKTILTWGELGADLKAVYPEVYASGWAHIYQNPEALPRAFLVHQVETVKDGRAALGRLQADGFDPHQSAIIEGVVSSLSLSTPGITPALVREHSPLRVEIETDSPRDGLLVLTDTWYPGWHALVDGREEPILRANYLFRGVPVPAGRHTVEFTYEPASFRIGFIVSIATMGAIVLLGVAIYARRFRQVKSTAQRHPTNR